MFLKVCYLIRQILYNEFYSALRHTARPYQELNKTSKPIATRDLHNLVDKGIVIMQGEAKRQIYYQLSQKRSNNEPIEPKMSQ
jgi:ATP-dependent DNA helicase RecG